MASRRCENSAVLCLSRSTAGIVISMDKLSAELEKARAAKATAARRFKNLQGINGIGLSRRGAGFALKVNFEAEPPVEIPAKIDGVDVIVEVVGKIRKLDSTSNVPTFHVVPHHGRWAVNRQGARRVSSTHKTQREAIPIARNRARKAGGVLIVHARDGSIRDRDSYENGRR